MRRSYLAVLLILATIFLSSCASPYIGRTVNMNHPSVCTLNAYPAQCSSIDKNFEISYRIDKTGTADEYSVNGTATYQGSATWVHFKNAVFMLLLISDGIIVETISATSSQGELGRSIHFERRFSTKSTIDGVLVTYKMSISG